MKNKIVIGLGFGDEGKGRVVDWLSDQQPKPYMIIRFSGGQQAAHCVYRNESDYHVFHNFGSGSFHNIPTYFSKYCTIDPLGILNEYDDLISIGVDPVLNIDIKCPVTTPFDKLYNIDMEKINNHGTCGTGFGATWQREEDFYSLTFGDLFYPEILKIKLNLIEKYYNQKKPTRLRSQNITNLKEAFLYQCNELIRMKNILPVEENQIFDDFISKGNCIFEGSQGLLLDQNIGFFPHVTRGNTCAKNAIKLNKCNDMDLFLVTRAYETRHGNGPMSKTIYIENPYEINDDSGHQGNFRTGILDLELLRYAINKSDSINEIKNKKLVITCLDVIKDDYRVNEFGHIFNTKSENDFIKQIANSLNINDVFISKSPYGSLQKV